MTELTILVPVYNEIQTIETILQRLDQLTSFTFELIIVDDNSTDGSREFLKRWSKLPGALQKKTRLFFHEKNQGKGAAIKTALAAATGQFFVVQDADLEYDPRELSPLLAATKHSRVVYGSRFMGTTTGMPTANYWANRGYNLLLRLLYGVKITDMHTCYKMIDTQLFRTLNLEANRFDYAAEIISKLLRQNEPILEQPINFLGRTHEEGKKIGLGDGWKCLIDLLRYRFQNTEPKTSA